MILRAGVRALLLYAVLFSMTGFASVISWSTYLGGSGMDAITAVATDHSGNVYVAGWTASANFPTYGPGSGFGGSTDAFVAKWSQGGRVLVYCRYLGGSGYDEAYGIAVDSSGNAYVTGVTQSTNFPLLNPLQSQLKGYQNAFVTKLDPSGNLLYSTYLGGNGSDAGNGIAVDSSGRAYVAGQTTSTNFPVLNALQSTNSGQSDAFVSLLSASGNQLVYSTYLGGSGSDQGQAIAIDSADNAYVTGGTNSSNFPVAGALQSSFGGGGEDAFVAKISSTGQALVYSTYLGGKGADVGSGIVLDASENVYVTGTTSSSNFPVVNAFQPSLNGSQDAFAAKLNASGNALIYSTYLGGSSIEVGSGIALDPSGNILVTGYTASTDFPVANALQPNEAGSYDAFFTRISPSGTSLVESTYLGGSLSDIANSIALDQYGIVYLAGQTLSTDFPIQNAEQTMNNGSLDGFVTQLAPPPQDGGFFDGASCNGAISGWAWNYSNPNTPLTVNILNGSTLIATVLADGFRPDLLSGGIGNGYYGFSYPFPQSLMDGQPHTIAIQIAGTGIALSDSPRTLTCPRFLGSLDGASCVSVSGWAWDSYNPDTPINVDILDGATVLTTVTANQYRPDLVAGIGSAYHGYSLPLPLSAQNGQSQSISARISPSGPVLPGSPKTVSCAQPGGFLDQATCTMISGWAWDYNTPSISVNVDILSGSTVVATVPANEYRPDLYEGGIGTGYYGFSYTPGPALLNGQTQSISARVSQTTFILGDSPKSLTCQ
jgi:hypothetical protein